MRDFLKLAKQKLKTSRPRNQSPTFVAVPQIDEPVKAQSESVQTLSAPEPQVATIGEEATQSRLDASREANPLLEEAKKRYKESTVSLDHVRELYVAKHPHAKAMEFQELVQVVLDDRTDKVEMLPIARPVATAVSKLIPLIKLALGLTQNVADVFPLFSIVSDDSGCWFRNSQTECMWLSGSPGSTNSPPEELF
jgi:hypothetical protein